MLSSSLVTVLRQLERTMQPPVGEESSDAKLLERFCVGQERNAFEMLVRRHGPLVWRVCRRVLGDGAEDAFQATFLVLARRARSIRKPNSLSSWLHGVAFRIARSAKSNTQRRPCVPRSTLTSAAVDPAREAATREIGRIIEEEVAALPERLRLPILLCYWEGKTNDKVARQLGWALGTVKTRVARARELLHARLVRRGVSMSIGAVSLLLAPEAAKATLPMGLLSATLHAGNLGLAGSHGIGAQVVALADAATKGSSLFKVMTLGVLALGLGAAVMGLNGGATPNDPRVPTVPAPLVQGARQDDEPEKPRVDLHGDPLPPGVLKRFGTARLRHVSSTVVGFADNKTVMSFGRDNKIRFWDVASGTFSQELPGPEYEGSFGGTWSLSPDGSSLASVSYKPTTRVLLSDLKTGKVRRIIITMNWPANRLAFSPDGRTLAVAEENLRLCDPITGKDKTPRWENREFRQTRHVAFSPDSKRVAFCLQGGMIVLLDVETGKELRKIEEKDAACVTFAPDNKTLITTGGWQKGAQLWDVETGAAKGNLRPIGIPQKPRPAIFHGGGELAFSHDGKVLVTYCPGETTVIWDFAARTELRRLTSSAGQYLMFSPDDKILAGSANSAIILWDIRTGKELHPSEAHGGQISGVAMSQDGRLIASCSLSDKSIRIWDAATTRLVHVLEREHFSAAHYVVFTPDGRTLMTGGRGNVIRHWDTTTGKQLKEQALGSPKDEERQAIVAMRLSRDSKRLAALLQTFGDADPRKWLQTLWAWDNDSGREIVRRPYDHDRHIRFSPDAKSITWYNYAGDPKTPRRLTLEDVETGKGRQLALAPSTLVSYSPDGRLLCSGNGEPTIWDLKDNREVATLQVKDVYFATISPDNRYVVTAREKALRVWEVGSGKEALNLDRHVENAKTRFSNPVMWYDESCTITFTPNGRGLVSGMEDGSVLMWNMAPDREAIQKAAGLFAAPDLQRLWDDLGGKDAALAYVATHALAGGPAPKVVAFLGERLTPAKGVDPETLAKLLQELESEKFPVRDAATKELEKSLDDLRPALERAIKQPTLSLETQRRLDKLLARPMALSAGDTLRQVRAVAILERIGTVAARQLLERLAQGNGDARLTREAVAAVARLTAK